MSFAQWRVKDSVKTSMHWATPKTSGRMLENLGVEGASSSEALSLNPSPVKECDLDKMATDIEEAEAAAEDDETEDVTYDGTNYGELGYRVSTPPGEWESEPPKPPAQKLKKRVSSTEMSEASKSTEVDPATAMRRRQFASRRESTIGAMVMAEKWEDTEIRRRFRNYEI